MPTFPASYRSPSATATMLAEEARTSASSPAPSRRGATACAYLSSILAAVFIGAKAAASEKLREAATRNGSEVEYLTTGCMFGYVSMQYEC
mmetsp:Transcript_30004/g.87665  ORF Transcript_30004/g.87665 Transcript_30004/m.87665 type:complete len:91 (+) Transcript_30004:1034-1306(+)